MVRDEGIVMTALTNAERQQRFRDRKKVVPKPPAITLHEIANRIRKLNTRIVEDVVNIGRDLIKAKEQLQHGEWLPWLEKEFAWSERTASRYMRLAELANQTRLSDLARLPLSGLYQLASPSTPDEVVDTVIERAAAGERITGTTVKQKIKKAKKAKQSKRAKATPEDSAAVFAQVQAMAAIDEDKPVEAVPAEAAQKPEKMTPRERCFDDIRWTITVHLAKTYGTDRARMFADLRDLIDRIEAEPEFDDEEETEAADQPQAMPQ
jgi:hypothetical protein